MSARKSEPTQSKRTLNLGWLFMALVAAAFAAAAWSIIDATRNRADPEDAAQIALGTRMYDRHCAACHGAKLEGQPAWKDRLANGRMPAPPHDATGHTWHHPDGVLFGITKEGLVPGRYAPPGYQSDMPGFGGALSDAEIWAVLAYIKASWSPRERGYQAELTRKAAARQ